MRLLIIGTLEGHISEAGKIAHKDGAKVSHADDTQTALNALRDGKGADLVMIDVTQDIKSFMESLKQERIHVEVVACGVNNDADTAVAAIKAGAKEYIPLPPDPELIAAVLSAVAEETTDFIFSDPKMKQVIELANQIAPSEASVLITGESGTGKEVMARYIHGQSKREKKKFVSINCAAIPDNLLESELFGHEKGAFTGAVARRIGKFEEADGGTLLLDEISEMDPRLQAKLLRAIQEREIDRVGGDKPVKVDIRLLATSNRNLQESVKKGEFREDLYFRLNVVNIQMPSLKDRPKDIEMLSKHFAKKYAEVNSVPVRPLSEGALQKLAGYNWPGNVRELENTMHRAVLMANGDEISEQAILLTHQSADNETPQTVETNSEDIEASTSSVSAETMIKVGKTVAEVEKDLIIKTLDHCLGNRTHAANILGISIRTLRNKLKQYTEDGMELPGAEA